MAMTIKMKFEKSKTYTFSKAHIRIRSAYVGFQLSSFEEKILNFKHIEINYIFNKCLLEMKVITTKYHCEPEAYRNWICLQKMMQNITQFSIKWWWNLNDEIFKKATKTEMINPRELYAHWTIFFTKFFAFKAPTI